MEEGLVIGARSSRFRLTRILRLTMAKIYRTPTMWRPWPTHFTQNPSFRPHSEGLGVDHPQLYFAYEET